MCLDVSMSPESGELIPFGCMYKQQNGYLFRIFRALFLPFQFFLILILAFSIWYLSVFFYDSLINPSGYVLGVFAWVGESVNIENVQCFWISKQKM